MGKDLGEGPLPFGVSFRVFSFYVGASLAILGSCWPHLGSNLAILAPTWPSWLHLGAILSHIRLRLGASWSILGVVGPLKVVKNSGVFEVFQHRRIS